MTPAELFGRRDAQYIVEDVFDNPLPEIRLAKALLAGFLLLFVGGLALLPMDSAATGVGMVSVSGNRQSVQHRTGGTVSALYVKEGQTVRKGDVLLALSSSDIAAQERALALETFALIAQRERLLAERDGRGSVNVPAEFTDLNGDDKAIAMAALTAQKRVFDARRVSSRTQIGIFSQRDRQASTQVQGLQRQVEANREQRRLIGDELSALNSLAEQGFTTKTRLRAVEREAAQLDGEFGALTAQIAKMGEASGEIALQSVGVKQELDKEVSQDLRDVMLRLDENKPKLAALQEDLQRAQLKAPASGRVFNLRAFTVGGVVAPGEVILEIVPDDRDLVVAARLSPAYADDIRVGQEAQIRFPGLHSRGLPRISGRIATVSADSKQDDRTGQGYFQIEVQVSRTTLQQEQKLVPSSRIVAGMPAEVFVPLRKRSALQFLLEPLVQSFWYAGRED